jgi:hypothetical protein
MAQDIVPPFSARKRGAQVQIDNDCPETTRMGLLHILCQLVELKYVEDWREVVGELQRIGRVSPHFDPTFARSTTEELLTTLAWDKIFDFCERLYGHLAQEVTRYSLDNEPEILAPMSAVQECIASELQRLFLEENLAFEFSSGLVRRRGRRHTAIQVARSELVLGDPRFSSARTHFIKALKY